MANVETAAIAAWHHAGGFADGDRLRWRRATRVRAGPTAIVLLLSQCRCRNVPLLPLLAGSAPLGGRLLALRGSGRLPWLARLAGRARLLRLALLGGRRCLPDLPLLDWLLGPLLLLLLRTLLFLLLPGSLLLLLLLLRTLLFLLLLGPLLLLLLLLRTLLFLLLLGPPVFLFNSGIHSCIGSRERQRHG